MDKLKITGNGKEFDTKILDTDGNEIKGLAVEKLVITQDAMGPEPDPQCVLTLVPGSFEFDMQVEVDEIQKDILSEFANKLFLIQDSLHGKSLDNVQNEIYEVQRQLEIIVKSYAHEKAKMIPKGVVSVTGNIEAYFEDTPAIQAFLDAQKELNDQPVDMKNRMAYCPKCDATHQITDKDGNALGLRQECLVAIFNVPVVDAESNPELVMEVPDENHVNADWGNLVDGHKNNCGITNIPPHCTCKPTMPMLDNPSPSPEFISNVLDENTSPLDQYMDGKPIVSEGGPDPSIIHTVDMSHPRIDNDHARKLLENNKTTTIQNCPEAGPGMFECAECNEIYKATWKTASDHECSTIKIIANRCGHCSQLFEDCACDEDVKEWQDSPNSDTMKGGN